MLGSHWDFVAATAMLVSTCSRDFDRLEQLANRFSKVAEDCLVARQGYEYDASAYCKRLHRVSFD